MILAAIAAFALQTGAAPAEVVSAESAATLTPGTIAVRPPPVSSQRRTSPEQVFADAVGDALVDAGFTAIPGVDHARYVASIEILREGRGAVTTRAQVDGPSVAGGAVGTGPGGSVAIGLPTRNSTVGALVETELVVRITERGREGVVWEGHAVTHQVDGTAAGAPSAVAAKLAKALFRNFPQPSGLRISVP